VNQPIQVTPSILKPPLVVGTRGSLLARKQTQWVVDQLTHAYPELDIRTEVITTQGDQLQGQPLPEIGGKGLFTEELEQALRDGSIDIAVHSAKDLPTQLPAQLAVLAYPAREDPRDAWVACDGLAFDDLPPNSQVGTTSLRRQAQLLMCRKDITFVQLRGNVDTRIKKIHRGDCAGAVLAMAGLNRTGLAEHVTHPFAPTVLLPAPGQGALAIEGRADDTRVQAILQAVNHPDTAAAVSCERAVLDALDAGCRAPAAVYVTVEDDELYCQALVVYPDGTQPVRVQAVGPLSDVTAIAHQVVTDLRHKGADEIITSCRPNT